MTNCIATLTTMTNAVVSAVNLSTHWNKKLALDMTLWIIIKNTLFYCIDLIYFIWRLSFIDWLICCVYCSNVLGLLEALIFNIQITIVTCVLICKIEIIRWQIGLINILLKCQQDDMVCNCMGWFKLDQIKCIWWHLKKSDPVNDIVHVRPR